VSGDRDEIFVNGAFETAHSNERIRVINPATEEEIGSIPDGDAEDIDRAVRAARDAFDTTDWKDISPRERAVYLRGLARAVEARAEEMAVLVSSQNGMPISMSRVGNGSTPAASYRYFADLGDQLEVEEVRGSNTIVRREPVGVAGLILPWNGPQAMIAWKLGPAMVAGCTVVIKPSPETSLDAYLFAEAVIEAGIPPGVVNFVTGDRLTGDALVRHAGVDKIAFTGSSAAGRLIAETCGAMLKPATLELGGKSAAIILEDADLEAFRPLVSQVCSPNTGQVCRACTRVLAPRSRYDEVVGLVAEAMSDVPMGDPMDPSMVFGPLVAERQRDRVEGYIRLGTSEGAKVVVGGGRPSHRSVGFYVEPTVFRDVDNSMRIAREEIFGPVLVVIPYDDEDDAVRIANDSDYGLGGYVFTSDVERGTRLARRIESGTVGVNHYAMAMDSPFGGYKNSGLGRELGRESLDAYLQSKSLYRPSSP
jgi:aldehyde dehydrogenase (NAD+)